ncbi:hypothetical protein ACQ4PT_055543 [Festuca glaucescens]
MGNLLAKKKQPNVDMGVKFINDPANTVIDARYTMNYMEDGGCGQQFRRASHECHPRQIQLRRERGDAAGISAEECARATEALLKCMKCRPEHFNGYISRIEEGLDQDQRPEKVSSKPPGQWDFFSPWFRWWEGMRRG